MLSHSKTVAIVGVTGAVGREALSILESRGFPAEKIVPLASARSAGSTLPYRGETIRVRELTESAFAGVNVSIFCATSGISKQFAAIARAAGSHVVDNSSAFRMDPLVPLVVPEVNPSAIPADRTKPLLIANPNCSTIILLVAINPWHQRFGIEHATVSTYQAVSGAGAAAMDELREQVAASLESRPIVAKVFAEQCAFNVFSHNSAVDTDTGLNVEETKLIKETHKIWGDSTITITPTCVRVPVYRAHSESAAVRFSRAATHAQVRAAFDGAPGVKVLDDRAGNRFPTPLKTAGGDDVWVGRIRPDPAYPLDSSGATRHWCIWVCGDQLRKGAAQNAIQIADVLCPA
jgi:aspartate-semialdehyde dehydrogenase